MNIIETYEQWSNKLQNIQEYQLIDENGVLSVYCNTFDSDGDGSLEYIGEILNKADFVKTCDKWHEDNM